MSKFKVDQMKINDSNNIELSFKIKDISNFFEKIKNFQENPDHFPSYYNFEIYEKIENVYGLMISKNLELTSFLNNLTIIMI